MADFEFLSPLDVLADEPSEIQREVEVIARDGDGRLLRARSREVRVWDADALKRAFAPLLTAAIENGAEDIVAEVADLIGLDDSSLAEARAAAHAGFDQQIAALSARAQRCA